MGFYMRDAFVKTDEHHAAWLNEMEFAEMAHVLKMLAVELGQEIDPSIDALAAKGLDAALGTLSPCCEGSVTEAYYRHRALWRAGQAFMPPVD